jgi:hypothetical protein
MRCQRILEHFSLSLLFNRRINNNPSSHLHPSTQFSPLLPQSIIYLRSLFSSPSQPISPPVNPSRSPRYFPLCEKFSTKARPPTLRHHLRVPDPRTLPTITSLSLIVFSTTGRTTPLLSRLHFSPSPLMILQESFLFVFLMPIL